MTLKFSYGPGLSLTDRVQLEQSQGLLDINRSPVPPAIPDPGNDIKSVRDSVSRMKAWIEQREGISGSVLDKHLTLRDLMDEGALGLRVGGQMYSGLAPSAIDMGSGYSNPLPVLVTPPAPASLAAQGAFKNVVLTWSLSAFANFAYVEVYRSSSNALGTATLIGTSTANIYTDANVSVGATYYYWVRAIAIGGAPGPYNAVGGTSAALLTIGNTDLGPLVVTAEKLSQGTYPNINLVANPGSEDGAVAWESNSENTGSGTFTASSAAKAAGNTSFRMGKSSATDRVYMYSTAFPVIPGETYSVKFKVLVSVPFSNGFYARLYEKTVKPSTLSVNDSNLTSVTNLIADGTVPYVAGGFTSYEYSYTVPAGIYWASLNFINYSTTSVAVDMYVDDCIVGRQITASFIAANAIAVGTAAIQNGAIVNAMIANATIDNAKIASVDAGTITVGTLAAARIATGSLDASKITSSTITATQIAANTITAGKMNVTNLAAISATLGSVTIDTTGAIIGGMSSYGTGSGFALGYYSSVYKFLIGNKTGAYMEWDGSTLTIVNAAQTKNNYPTTFAVDLLDYLISPNSATAVTAIRLNTNGTVESQQGSGASWVAAGNWFTPTTTSIGSSYKVQASVEGSALTSGTTGIARVALSSVQTYSLNQVYPGAGIVAEKKAKVTFSISTNADPTVLAQGIALLDSFHDV